MSRQPTLLITQDVGDMLNLTSIDHRLVVWQTCKRTGITLTHSSLTATCNGFCISLVVLQVFLTCTCHESWMVMQLHDHVPVHNVVVRASGNGYGN